MEIIYRKIADLIPYVNNSRTHSEEQVKQIASSIKEYGFTNPVLIDEDNGIIAGHGRVLAAGKLNMEEVPCIMLSGLTEAQKKAYVIADNKMALNAGWNEELLKLELTGLKETGYDLALTGFDNDELDKLFGIEDTNNPYSSKVSIPLYEITGEQPSIQDLCDEEKVNELMEEIKNSNVTDEQKEFLFKAAARHYVFNYKNIAEYYAHQDKEMQDLMEKSALVIIDINKAMQYGYVELLEDLVEMQEGESDE